MWLQTITIISLTAFFCPLCNSAEISSSINHEQLSVSSFSENTALDSSSTSPLATYQQALDYLLGRNGMPRSEEKAAALFKSLAQQNWSSAQHMLGNMYYAGKGVEKNDLLAYKWLSLASKNNLQLSEAIQTKRKRLHQKLQNSLSQQSLDEVETWIAEWQPSGNKL